MFQISDLCQMFYKYFLPICSLPTDFLNGIFQPKHQYFITFLLKYTYKEV